MNRNQIGRNFYGYNSDIFFVFIFKKTCTERICIENLLETLWVLCACVFLSFHFFFPFLFSFFFLATKNFKSLWSFSLSTVLILF
ncbi:hypothetical protein GDO81_029936 [Engystomops pustulosus]|uniref:Uncharacterized protein n=1 Tax=Engystomops pustulosus TaxID=76066 RepID=A0AAV6ZUK9_ENGPU|nr:hypothetical protein GDO81_029936 [Engystomops pustulosus]